MNKQFPTKEKVVYIVCEDVREELGSKVSLQGVFGGRTILLERAPEKGEQASMPTLSIYIGFHDGTGEFEADAQLIDPDGVDMLKASNTKQTVNINEYGMNLVYKFSPFLIKIGTYRMVALLDGRSYEETFKVDVRRAN